MFKKIIVLFLFLPALALAGEFIEGKDYKTIASTGTQSSNKAIVKEYFSYGCPWCYRLEKPLHQWLKNEGNHIKFERIPVVFNANWEIYAKAYYTADVLSLTQKMTPLLFKAIQDKHQSLDTSSKMIQFFVANGVNQKIAESAFEHSPSIEMHVKKAMESMARYQINAVPAFVINNQYKTDLQMARSPERLFEIINFLLKKNEQNSAGKDESTS